MLLLFSEAVQNNFKQLHLEQNKPILRLALIHLPVSAQKRNQQELNPYLNALLNWILERAAEQATFLEQ